MKKYIDILEDIKQTREAIKTAEAREDELIKSYMKQKAVENDMIKVSEKKKDLRITINILQNNARIALFDEVLPVALDILSKYAGKPYGEKTKQRISDAVKEATNCSFYIHSRYGSDSINVYPVNGFGNDYSITCGTKYINGRQRPLLIDNKIQTVSLDEIELYYISREYVADIPQRIEDIKAAYAEAVAKQEELKAACDRFNILAVGDIKNIYSDKHIYSDMTI